MNPFERTWIVPDSAARDRLDRFLAQELPGESRSRIQLWIRQGRVRVNDAAAKTGYSLRARDRITLHVAESPAMDIRPEAIPLAILCADPDFVVIDKPAGLVCHAGAGVRSGTLVNALLYHLGNLQGGDPERPGIVHRLDKGTSGVMVVARNDRAHRSLAQQFKSREVRKEYLALVYGHPRPPSGTVRVPIGRDPHIRTKVSPRARKKRDAVTHYATEQTIGAFSLLRVTIETGRTHQIRVHLAHIGHPVVGDETYGGRRYTGLPPLLLPLVRSLGRPFLHASRIEFRHPGTGAQAAFASPLPAELQRFIADIRTAAGLA